MSPKRAWHLLFIVFLLGTAPAVARAEAGLPECGSNPACRSLFEQAREQSDHGNLPEALRLYRLAYEVRADPALLFSIARVLHKMGQLPEAAAYYEEYIRSPIDAPEQKRKAQEHLQQLGPQPPLASPILDSFASGGAVSPPSGPLPRTPPPPVGRVEAKPVYRRGWFWGVLGGTAVAAGGLMVGILLSTRETVANGTPAAFHIHF